MKETATRLVDKRMLLLLADDKLYQEYIKKELSTDLCHSLMDILKHEKEIKVRLSDVRAKDSPLVDGVEYRQEMDWNPLVRCKDCKFYDGNPCGVVDWWNGPDDFCSRGERRIDG